MRLTTIKLSGFKSFVDPTTLHLPTNMTGIVGPNGCGKSNIIDAIRWVMGESAASRLRGDAITDVIFTGSGTRKPVGTAMVELIFDNADGSIGGEYASFSEISVKRIVSRDGVSSYFLNGGRCRRRDIVDVFLGTGLGPRSYSIIEQGMISQIVEARPEDLRVHLEEAAGISKYKERRKETESRIKATRENLERLNDVREEVEKQLEHLNRQAKAAERYQRLKGEAARVEAELKALELGLHEAELASCTDALKSREIAIEAKLAEQRAIEAQLEQGRSDQIAASDAFNKVQSEVYRVGADIARVEQAIQHNKDLAQRLERARGETETALAEIVAHLEGDRAQITTLDDVLALSAPQSEELALAAEERAEQARKAEEAIGDWQTRWDAYAKASGEASRAAEVERTKLDYLDRQSGETGKRLETLAAERAQADTLKLADLAESLASESESQRGVVEQLTGELETRKAAHEATLTKQREAQAEQAQLRGQLEQLRGRLASLEALQHAALGQEKGPAQARIKMLGLDGSKRVGEVLHVADGWERAVETVLAGVLDGVVLEAPHDQAEALATVEDASMSMFAAGDASGEGAPGSLGAQVRGPASIAGILSKVRTAETLAQARDIARRLPAGESVITPAGEWFGPGWLRVVRGQAQLGVLAREREIHAHAAERDALTMKVEEIASRLESIKTSIKDAELSRDETQRELYAAHRRLAELSGQLQSQKGRIEAAEARLKRIEAETAELTTRRNDVDSQAKESRARLGEATAKMGELEQQRGQLDAERRKLLELREEARAEAREARERAHQLALQTESKRAALASLNQAVARMEAQRVTLESRRGELATQLEAGGEPLAQLDAERRTYLDQRLLKDKELVEARKLLDAAEQAMRGQDVERHRVERELTAEREALAGERLKEQGTRLRADTLLEAIAVAGFDIAAIKAEMSPEAGHEAWTARLEDLGNKIRRLEPVNLAAISEFGEQSQRKEYLDAQYNDLTTALDTLETAIKKIDRETRTRFKETFDKVNTGFGELFPRLFGGGHAYLELTGEDLLDTGVAILARPPGKRVSNISLLSGGEKALTAVALVFSIFRLNPAPFCLLDEVDAPLDEANVGRFCSMVSEMSDRVQFLMVTHNKATMEASTQLCGVTMREAGVSRLVQVDLAEAAKLAGAA